jgi:hypothetical protein
MNAASFLELKAVQNEKVGLKAVEHQVHHTFYNNNHDIVAPLGLPGQISE